MVKSYAVPDASTFLARRLVLSGPGRALAAGGMYGAGFIPTGMYLFLGKSTAASPRSSQQKYSANQRQIVSEY